MTYAGNASRSPNRVLIALVVVTIALVAYWGMSGGLDEIHASEPETAVEAD